MIRYNWVDAIKEHCDDKAFIQNLLNRLMQVHEDPENCVHGYINKPLTAEEVWYRTVFAETFGERNAHLISEIWRPRWTDVTDPSARQLEFFQESD